SQPVLSDMHVEFGPVMVERLHPAELPDLYTRSQIKICGRYRNQQDLQNVTIALTGQMNGQQRFEFRNLHFPLFTTDKDFLPKLWATERVSALLAEIRLSGEGPELKQEVVDLAREFNLVTPYTSMYVPTSAELAREKQDGEAVNSVSSQTQAQQSANTNGSNAATATRSMSALPRPSPGAVVDAQGAAIPNATVTIKDPSTGATRTVTTDESGNYDVAGLAPGTYKVEVTAPGFSKTQVDNVAVTPGQTAATGVTLSVASAGETVTVVASVAPALDLSTSHLSSTYESKKIKELPSLAPVDSLARLSPGVNPPALDGFMNQAHVTTRSGGNQPSINGVMIRSNGFTLDGHDNNDIDGRPAISINNADAVELLHIITTRGTGDASRTSGSSVSLITRSGTNDFHGSIFDFHLNRRLGAGSPLERRSGFDDLSRFKSDIFGGTFGGPIRRDRIFFFGAFQWEKATSRNFFDSTSSMLTPTLRGLEELSSRFPNSQMVSDLIARGPLARVIGNPRIARTFILPVLGSPIEFGEVVRSIPSETDGYEAGTRFDFELTNRDRLQAGYWYDSNSVMNSIGQLAAGHAGGREARAQLGSIQWTKLFSPKSTNELSFSFNRAGLSLTDSDLTAGSPGASSSPGVGPGFRGLNYGGSPLLPSSHASNLFETSETLAHIEGRHNLKLGGQVRARFTRLDSLPGAR
ncbi:MAG TPA: TonB-dependent receptor, partial [Blastocatellia bacterium]